MPDSRVRVLILPWIIICLLPSLGLAEGIAYRVEMPGLSAELSAALSSVSDCVTLRDSPPETAGLLATRMRNDLKSFADALDALGYFKANLDAELNTDVSPMAVRFRITPNQRFVLEQPELRLIPPDPETQAVLHDVLTRLKSGDGYASSLVLEVEGALLDALRTHGYPSPALNQRSVIADHATHTVHVRFLLDTGPKACFGQTCLDGLEQVTPEHVRKLLAWKTDAPFDSRLIDLTREQLIRTGLFRSVTVATGPVEAGRVDMRIHVLEAPHRTVRSGLWYYSDQGLGGSAGWVHRNLFGGGQELGLDAALSEKHKSTTATLAMPGMWHPDQTLGLSAVWEDELTDVYASRSLALSAVLTRIFSELRLGYGLAYRLAEVDEDGTRHFNLVSLPLSADLTTTDNALDPTSGLTFASRIEPFTAIGDRSSSFVLWSVAGSHYLELAPGGKLVLATRGQYAVLAGAGRERVPEDLLRYAGGGGSVRGYAYQYAGELDEDGDPMGGMSAVDLTAELRWRVTQDFGAVIFGDGGRAFADRNPGRIDDYFWAVGSGIRYYTPIGPIRMDVAVPLDRRDGVDDPFQVYVSLGQAF